MLTVEWWALPAFLEVLLTIACMIVANIDAPAIELAAACVFIAGTLAIGFVALGCYAISG